MQANRGDQEVQPSNDRAFFRSEYKALKEVSDSSDGTAASLESLPGADGTVSESDGAHETSQESVSKTPSEPTDELLTYSRQVVTEAHKALETQLAAMKAQLDAANQQTQKLQRQVSHLEPFATRSRQDQLKAERALGESRDRETTYQTEIDTLNQKIDRLTRLYTGEPEDEPSATATADPQLRAQVEQLSSVVSELRQERTIAAQNTALNNYVLTNGNQRSRTLFGVPYAQVSDPDAKKSLELMGEMDILRFAAIQRGDLAAINICDAAIENQMAVTTQLVVNTHRVARQQASAAQAKVSEAGGGANGRKPLRADGKLAPKEESRQDLNNFQESLRGMTLPQREAALLRASVNDMKELRRTGKI